MSNLWINWRFGKRHLQIGPDAPYISFKVNPYRLENPPDKFFEIY